MTPDSGVQLGEVRRRPATLIRRLARRRNSQSSRARLLAREVRMWAILDAGHSCIFGPGRRLYLGRLRWWPQCRGGRRLAPVTVLDEPTHPCRAGALKLPCQRASAAIALLCPALILERGKLTADREARAVACTRTRRLFKNEVFIQKSKWKSAGRPGPVLWLHTFAVRRTHLPSRMNAPSLPVASPSDADPFCCN
jgi:hypothetical protein